MSTTTSGTGPQAPYRSELPPGRDGFAQLLLSEWTKFRTVRGWLIGLVLAALLTVLFGLITALGTHAGCNGGCHFGFTVGPDGEAVNDSFYFVHQPLVGDGSITVRVTALTSLIPSNLGGPPPRQAGPPETKPGVVPWAKAGLMIKEDTTPGSGYAAIMTTGSHGVRMQSDYTHDTAGAPGAVSAASPRWLRLTRSGATLTGYQSIDGIRWTKVATTQLTGLSSTVQAGLFVASPDHTQTLQHFGASISGGGPTQSTASFDQLHLRSSSPTGSWSGGQFGGFPKPVAGFQESGGRYTLSGTGDIAPASAGPGPNGTLEGSLVGTFAGLIVVIVLGTMFITTEYRRGLIRTTLTASPRRGRVLAAKAVVLAGITFVIGLAAAAVAVWLCGRILREHGMVVLPVTTLTRVRVIAGTAALLAVSAVLALAVGTLLRRSAAAVAGVIVLVVLPYILSVASVLPVGAAQWVLRVTPAAGFAIQQSIPQYSQVIAAYTPSNGYYPLAPWAGFGVLCGWTALALGLAVVLVRRRDV